MFAAHAMAGPIRGKLLLRRSEPHLSQTGGHLGPRAQHALEECAALDSHVMNCRTPRVARGSHRGEERPATKSYTGGSTGRRAVVQAQLRQCVCAPGRQFGDGSSSDTSR